MKLKFVLYCTALLCTVFSLSRAGTWDTLYTRQTNMDVGGVTFAPDDSFVIVTGLETNSNNSITKMYRPSDGQLLDERPFYFKQFTQDGKYALIWLGDNNIPKLVDWRNNWQVITTFVWDSLSNTYTISADNQTLVGFNAKGYTLWDAQTGKQRKQSQIFSDTVLSGSGQNSTDKITSLQGSALLGDSRTLCIVVNQFVFSGSLNKELSNKYFGISIDIETGELKAGADNIRAFYAIPGSNNVITLGKKDVTKIDYNLLYQCNGNTLNKRFEYGGAEDLKGRVITFNQNHNYFIQGYAPGPLKVIETQTGILIKSSTVAGKAQNLSNTDGYFALVSGSRLFMYNTDKLFTLTDVHVNNIEVPKKLFPIPTSGILQLENDKLSNTETFTLELYDVTGNEVLQSSYSYYITTMGLMLDIKQLENGRYNLRIIQTGKVFSYSFILIK